MFISSTQKDLEEERRIINDELLSKHYIPIAMEYFTLASNDQPWTIVRKAIDQCDYYVVVVAGMYGTTLPDGTSYTENEYNYAISKKIPVLAFLREKLDLLPNFKVEKNAVKSGRLQQFRDKIIGSHTYVPWNDGNELARKISSSLDDYSRDHPAKGWIRGDAIPDGFEVDLKSILEPCKSLGIRLVSQNGIAEYQNMTARIKQASKIKIMATSGIRFLDVYRPALTQALINGAKIFLLVPDPESVAGKVFISDDEQSESEFTQRQGIAQEIEYAEARLRECLCGANNLLTNTPQASLLGSASIGFFTTHLRSTMVLCDDWGWLTITLPPLRAVETASFEIENVGPNCLFRACIRHFDRTWNIIKERKRCREIKVDSGSNGEASLDSFM